MDTPIYHIIPHTHWDREWYHSFEHFRVLLVQLIDELLDILETRPEYKNFLLDGQTSVVDDYLEVRPEKRAQIEAFVREGRLTIGPWYTLPDTLLVSGTSLVRNLELGMKMGTELGGSMRVGYVPDSFGHNAWMPKIFSELGFRLAIAWRGFGGEPGQEPSEYRWFAPDGSSIYMVHLNDQGYTGAYFGGAARERAVEAFQFIREKVDERALTRHRLILSGGDHHWPVRDLPEVIEEINTFLGGDGIAVHSSLPAFADAIVEDLEGMNLTEVHGELRFGYRWAYNVSGGVYSSRMNLKQANARSERLLEHVLEPMAQLAAERGGFDLQPSVDYGWKLLLQNHPHDSICGCSIDSVHREMETRTKRLQEVGVGVKRFFWQAIAGDGHEGAAGDDTAIVFWNPTDLHRDAVVDCDIRFFRQDIVVGLNPDVVVDPPADPVGVFSLVDEQGSNVDFETISRSDDIVLSETRYGYPSQYHVDRRRVRVHLKDIPARGFQRIAIVKEPGPAGPTPSKLSTGDGSIENEHVRVRADGKGRFYVFDKALDTEIGPLGMLEDGGDAGDEYNYSPPAEDMILRSDEEASVEVEVVPGRLRVGLKVVGTWEIPVGVTEQHRTENETSIQRFATTAYLTPGVRHVVFETSIENTARDHRLRVLMDTGRETNKHHAYTGLGVVDRVQRHHEPDGYTIEVPSAVSPMSGYVTVEDVDAGCTLVADGLPEYELKHDSNGVLALTLLRCVGQLSRGDLIMRPGGEAGWHNETPDAQCIGSWLFRYAFVCHLPGDRQTPAQIADEVLLPLEWTPIIS